MLAEGKNAITEVINSGIPIIKVMIENDAEKTLDGKILFKTINDKNIKYLLCTKDAMDKVSETKRHQGFIAIIPDFLYCEIDDILSSAKALNMPPFIVILDGITDPHNLGSIIRVCECCGVHGIIIPKNRSCDVNATVMRCSAGAVNHMLIAKVANLNAAIERLKAGNVFVFGAEANGTPMYKTNLKGSVALVIGSEGNGIHQLTKKLCDGIISIPMEGKINSLNASVACGIVLYEALRQRKI